MRIKAGWYVLGPFYGAISVPSITRCRCCRCRRCGHRWAGGVRQWRRAIVATPGEWQCKTGGVRRLAVANGPNILQMLLVLIITSTPAVVDAWLRRDLWLRVSVCVYAVKEKRLELSTPNVIHVLCDNISACIDTQVEKSKIKATGLWRMPPSWVCVSIWLLSFLVFERFIEITLKR